MTLQYIIIDVDGTLTDGGVYYDNTGNEFKKFNTKDGAGIKCAQAAGLSVIVLTGRECAATTRRLEELGVKYIHQGISNKVDWLRSWIHDNNIDKASIAYIGDDINDLGPMGLCGFIGCPKDAVKEVKDIADYISCIDGGRGAVRDVIEHILRENDKWSDIITQVRGAGV